MAKDKNVGNAVAATTTVSATAETTSAGGAAPAETAGAGSTAGKGAGAPSTGQSVTGAAGKPNSQSETKVNLTQIQKAAQFAGIPVDQVLDFKAYGDRFVVVTTSGHKISRTPAEREADARAAAIAAAQKAAAKAKK